MRDSTEFDAFYAATGARVMGQIYLMIGDRGQTEDAVAEAYARAWQRWDTVSAHADPAAWVRGVAYRIAAGPWRRATRRRADDPTGSAFADTLRQMPAPQRRAVVLHHLAGLTVAEIAAETGSSESAVRAHLAQGQTALAELLDATRETRE